MPGKKREQGRCCKGTGRGGVGGGSVAGGATGAGGARVVGRWQLEGRGIEVRGCEVGGSLSGRPRCQEFSVGMVSVQRGARSLAFNTALLY